MEPRPLFIVVDGLDGCGKTTFTQGICKELWGLDVPHLRAIEPSLSRVGVFVRNLLHTPSQQQTFEDREVLGNIQVMAHLFAADRALHAKVIDSNLADGKHVVCDRWMTSSLVYQCGCYGAEDPNIMRRFSQVFTLNQAVLDHRLPDLVIHLKVSPQVASERLQKSRGGWGRTYFEGEEFLKRDAELWDRAVAYCQSVLNLPTLVLDGGQPPNELVSYTMRELINRHPWFPRLPKGGRQ
jgi:dTMP kinase